MSAHSSLWAAQTCPSGRFSSQKQVAIPGSLKLVVCGVIASQTIEPACLTVELLSVVVDDFLLTVCFAPAVGDLPEKLLGDPLRLSRMVKMLI